MNENKTLSQHQETIVFALAEIRTLFDETKNAQFRDCVRVAAALLALHGEELPRLDEGHPRGRQWWQVKEDIEKTGRAIAANVSPSLRNIASETWISLIQVGSP